MATMANLVKDINVGGEDISDIGDGTLTGAIKEINDDLGGLSFGIKDSKYGYYQPDGTFVNFKQLAGTAKATDVLSGKTFANSDSESVTGTMTNRGAVTTAVAANGSYTIAAGYHNGSGVVSGPTLSGDAVASQVLSGKKFYNTSDTVVTGTMTNNSTMGISVGVGATASIPKGYYDGTGKVTGPTLSGTAGATDVYENKTFYNTTGTAVKGTMAVLSSANFTSTHTSATGGDASTFKVTSSSAGYLANNTIVGQIAAVTSPTIAATAASGTVTINVKPGYYNKISVNQVAAYNAGTAARAVTSSTYSKSVSTTKGITRDVTATATISLAKTNYTLVGWGLYKVNISTGLNIQGSSQQNYQASLSGNTLTVKVSCKEYQDGVHKFTFYIRAYYQAN